MTLRSSPTDFAQVRPRIREILLADWDPHDLYKWPEAQGAYDAWIEPVYELLRAGADEEQVMGWLHEREQESMCFPSLGKECLRRVARKLRAL